MKDHFDISRFVRLLRLELFKSRKGVLMALVITVGLLFFLGMLLDIYLDKSLVVFNHDEGFAGSLLVSGFILSSLAFSELGNPLKRHQFLVLPVSAFERFTSMWLLTSVGWIVVLTLVYTLYAAVANVIGQMLFSEIEFLAFDPFGSMALSSMKYYFVLQGIFLAGYAHFRGYALPKTLVALVIVASVAGLLVYFLLRDVFFSEHECNGADCILVNEIGEHGVWLGMQVIFWWLLAPFCWLMTYLGLKDQEV